MIQRRQLMQYGVAAAAGIVPATGFAQTSWPDKPVRIIVLFGAGGTADTLTRMLADKLQTRFKQTFIVENRTGAGGNIGMASVKNAPADGYTIASATIGTLSINQFLYAKLGYDPETDFDYVSTFWENCNVFAVSSDHPARTLGEFREWALKQPKGVTYSSSGVGTTPHLAGELFGTRTGIKTLHIPFRSSAMLEVVSRRIDFAIDNVSGYAPFIKAGKARALAVTSQDRWPGFADVPTMAEAGLPNFVITSWGALVMPAGTPAAITQKLSQAVQEISALPEMKELFMTQVTRAVSSSPQETVAFAARERAKWKDIVSASGAKAD